MLGKQLGLEENVKDEPTGPIVSFFCRNEGKRGLFPGDHTAQDREALSPSVYKRQVGNPSSVQGALKM